jgi:hypothetical protein
MSLRVETIDMKWLCEFCNNTKTGIQIAKDEPYTQKVWGICNTCAVDLIKKLPEALVKQLLKGK